MASTRKKQDEKNLKTLRELVSLPYNKYCFDCNQRGPTYVNVTIGSFVCTKCSGMLRGLTPPHRVKSISMATFTPEEVELVQNRGNEYCRRTWLGLYEGAPLSETRDEQQVHDLMVEKYERRRFYIDQPVSGGNVLHNNNTSSSSSSSAVAIAARANGVKPLLVHNDVSSRHSPLRRVNGLHNGTVDTTVTRTQAMNNGITISRPVVPASMSHNVGVVKATDFVANFDSADIFNATNNNSSNTNGHRSTSNNNNGAVLSNGIPHSPQNNGVQPSFANFDNNPVFTNTNHQSAHKLQHHHKTTANVPPAPPEDRYAALKDLDNALKNQSTLDWSSSNSSSVYSSPTPTSSMYNSSSPQSLYGSPSQGQFISIFSQQETGSNTTSNPFNSGQVWGNSTNMGTTATAPPQTNGMTNGSNPNPFRVAATVSDPFKMNGFTQNFQQSSFAPINGAVWAANPFKVTSNGHSSNPFL